MQKLGKYEIMMELGHGAMGVVYKARDPFIGRLVALKTINSNLVDRPDLLERFYQEAQSAGKLQHPNIVTIFELGQEKDTPFIAMEYLDGDSLEKTIVRQIDLPLAMRVGYIVRICQALEYAHKNRVVHRDIKPGNIMVNSEGVVKVVDFGIARLVDFSRTHTNMMIGTPAYMAPELFRKKKADERTDIWAVGVTFFELLAYQRPFTGDGYDIISSIMEDQVPGISALVPDCPAEVEAVIQRMLRKASAERYQSMEDVLLDLEPVWNRLRASEAAALAERGRELYQAGDLVKAQERLRRARQIDSGNTLAKSLLEKISAEVRRSEIEPRIQEHLTRSRGFIQAGQLREAQAEVEAALGLDSRHEPAQKLFAEVEGAVARSQQLEQKLRLAKQRLAEGALDEADSALRQGLDLDGANAQALDLQRQIAGERARREKRKQVGELLQRARGLWTELKYDECLALLAEGLTSFPNEPELKHLQETARADQAEQRKQQQISEVRKLVAQQKLGEARKSLDALSREAPQDSAIRNLQALLSQEEQEHRKKKRLEEELTNLRGLVSAGKLKEAITRGDALLRDFPQEYEIQDLLAYAKGEVAQQEQKKKEEDRAGQIRGLLDAQRYPDALAAARQAAQEFPKQELFRGLAAEAERLGKEQQEREKAQREVQQRIQEIRSKIKRQELSDAIDLARQTLASFGTDTDVKQLLGAAELEAAERDKKNQERQKQVEAAKTLLDRGDLAGATQLLDQGVATKVLLANDQQVKLLRTAIADKEELRRQAEDKKKKDDARKRDASQAEEERKRKESEKQKKAEGKGPGLPPAEEKPGKSGTGDARAVPPPASAPTVLEPTGATQLASSGMRPKPSLPVMTPLPATPPDKPSIQTHIHIREGTSGATAPPVSGGLLKKPAVLAGLAVLVLGGAYGVYLLVRHPTPPPSGADPADITLSTEAKQLWADHKLDESLADWTKLAGHAGPLQNEAASQVAEINKKHADIEQLYAQGMKLLYEDKNYSGAADKFNQVVQMNLWKLDDARKELDIASKGPGSAPAKPIWQAFFEEGRQAFDRKDYAVAQDDLQKVLQANGVSRDVNNQAQRLLNVIRDREQQKKDLDQALELARGGQKQAARDLFARVLKASNGDPEVAASAGRQIAALDATPPPNPNPNPNPNPPKAPDYAPMLADVRSLIGQGRWDDAEARLSGVPASQPEYGDLKRLIDAGRRDDQSYAQMKNEFTQADASKNKEALRGIRQFFTSEANNGGRHSGDARNIVAEIDTDLSRPDVPPVNNPPLNPPPSNDAAAINSVIQRFAKAYNDGNLAALRAVREYDPKDEKKLPEILSRVKGQGYTLQNCSAPQITGDAASISCDVFLSKMPQVKPSRTNIHLKNFEGQWIIISSD